MKPVKLEHPNADQLTAFSLGKLSDAESGRIEAHLENCEPCRLATEAAPDDTLVSLIRSQDTSTDSLSAAARETPTLSVADMEDRPEAEELAEILAPAAKPDELGRLGGYRVLKLL